MQAACLLRRFLTAEESKQVDGHPGKGRTKGAGEQLWTVVHCCAPTVCKAGVQRGPASGDAAPTGLQGLGAMAELPCSHREQCYWTGAASGRQASEERDRQR